MYVILKRNGWIFATVGMDYVVINPQGEIMLQDMNKKTVETAFMQLSR